MSKENSAIVVGFDAKRIVKNQTGLGNYSRYIVETLARYAPEVTQLLSTAEVGKKELYESLLAYSQVKLVLPPSSIFNRMPYFQAYWRNKGALPQLRGKGMTIYHGLSNELPSDITTLDVPSVVTMHDLIYERFPQFYSPVDVKLYRHKYERSCREATHIIAVSECTKRDLIEIYKIPENKISVIYQGCAGIFRKRLTPFQIDKVTGEYLLPSEYILTVGTVEERKNAGLIVEALSKIKNSIIPLVIVGRETKYAYKVKQIAHRLGVEHRLIFLEGVPSQDLPAMYQGASLFVYPSLYEGFGIPVLEALCSRIPVIAATGSCLEEAGGPHSLYCDPKNADDLAQLMDRALEDEELRKKMIAEGEEWSKKFLPEHTAVQLTELYRTLQQQ